MLLWQQQAQHVEDVLSFEARLHISPAPIVSVTPLYLLELVLRGDLDEDHDLPTEISFDDDADQAIAYILRFQ